MSEVKNDTNFKDLYNEVKTLYPNVVELTETEVENIQSQSVKDNSIDKTNTYLLAIIAATIFLLIFPFFATRLYTSLSIVTTYLVTNKGTFPKELIQTLNFSFGIGGFAIISYFFLLPSTARFKKLFKVNSPFDSINRTQSNFLFSSIIGAYITVGLIGLLLYLNLDSTATFIAENFKYYLLIPLFLIAVLLVLIIVTLLIMFPFKKLVDRKSKQTSGKRIDICMKLLKTLKKISPFDNFYFLSPEDSKMIMSNLRGACTLIMDYPKGVVEFLDNSEIEDDFLKAGREFEKNIVYFISTKESHTSTIKSTLVNYLNSFLSGDLSALPKNEIVIQNDKIKKAKLIHYFLLGLYLTLPIIVILILKLAFKITLDEYMQSLMRILYIIWAFVGIFSNPFVLNTESKDLLKDIIKTLTGKG